MKVFSSIDFIEESNRIEGISRPPTEAEILEFQRFLRLDKVTVLDLKKFVKVYQPNAVLRTKHGLNVRVGDHLPPAGGAEILPRLTAIVDAANGYRGSGMAAYHTHHDYETLHPFTDGNGRSGRMLWMWMMREAPLGFLHQWYYQSLTAGDPA